MSFVQAIVLIAVAGTIFAGILWGFAKFLKMMSEAQNYEDEG